MSVDRRLDHTPARRETPHTERAPGARRARPAVRRAADRHYLGVVAAEARRLGRQLRTPQLASASARRANLDHDLPNSAEPELADAA